MKVQFRTTVTSVTVWVRTTTPEQVSAQARQVSVALATVGALLSGMVAVGMEAVTRVVDATLSLPATWWLIGHTSVEFVSVLVAVACGLAATLAVFGSPMFPTLCRVARRPFTAAEEPRTSTV